MVWPEWWHMNTVVPAGGFFDRREEMKERLRQGPGDEARQGWLSLPRGLLPVGGLCTRFERRSLSCTPTR